MNVLGNHHIGTNVRIMLINNGRGQEFRNYTHPAAIFGNDADKFVAAGGHFGNMSKKLVHDYAIDLGFEYLSASNKEEFNSTCAHFLVKSKKINPLFWKSLQIRSLKTMPIHFSGIL